MFRIEASNAHKITYKRTARANMISSSGECTLNQNVLVALAVPAAMIGMRLQLSARQIELRVTSFHRSAAPSRTHQLIEI